MNVLVNFSRKYGLFTYKAPQKYLIFDFLRNFTSKYTTVIYFFPQNTQFTRFKELKTNFTFGGLWFKQIWRMGTSNTILFCTCLLYSFFFVWYERVYRVHFKMKTSPKSWVFLNYLEGLPAVSDLEKAHLKCIQQMYKL